MNSINKNDLGIEIWRSQLKPSIKVEKYIIVGITIFLLVSPMLFLPLFLNMLSLRDSFIIFLLLQAILSLTALPLLILSIRYLFTYIIIHEKGILAREKSILKRWKRRFITFGEIEGIEIGFTSRWTANGMSHHIKKLIIKVKGKKSYQISSSWVKDVEHVKELVKNRL